MYTLAVRSHFFTTMMWAFLIEILRNFKNRFATSTLVGMKPGTVIKPTCHITIDLQVFATVIELVNFYQNNGVELLGDSRRNLPVGKVKLRPI